MRKFLAALVALAPALALLGGSDRAHAEATASTSCMLTGKTLLPTGLEVFDAATGGRAIAKFSGAWTELVASEFPSDPSQRAKVRTGLGKGGFRVDGFVDASKIPVFTNGRTSAVPGLVWIDAGREVQVLGGSGDKLKIAKKLSVPFTQTFNATAECSGLTLSEMVPPGWSVPGEARGYLMNVDTLELFTEPSADAASVTLYRTSSDIEVLFWSESRKGSWVHLSYHGEIVAEGWARAKDVKALPRGETMDSQTPPRRVRTGAKLGLATQPREYHVTRELPLRIAAKDAEAPVGVIEAETDVLVLDVIAGWASVLPKSLNVVPAGEGSFYVKASDVGWTPPR